MGKIRDFFDEWAARRRGSKHVDRDIQRAARDLAGPLGNVFSNGWDTIHGENAAREYVESFDRRLPPSEFVSERDRLRSNRPIPTAERCLESFGESAAKDETPPREWTTEAL